MSQLPPGVSQIQTDHAAVCAIYVAEHVRGLISLWAYGPKVPPL